MRLPVKGRAQLSVVLALLPAVAWGQRVEVAVPAAPVGVSPAAVVGIALPLSAPVLSPGALAAGGLLAAPIAVAVPIGQTLPMTAVRPAALAAPALSITPVSAVAPALAQPALAADGEVRSIRGAVEGLRELSSELLDGQVRQAGPAGALDGHFDLSRRQRERVVSVPSRGVAPVPRGFQPGAPDGRGPPAKVDGQAGRALLQSAHQGAARGHRDDRGYKESKKYMFGVADHVQRGGRGGVVEAYSQIFVPGSSPNGGDYRENGDQDGDGWVEREGMNAEHVWPQSFFAKKLPMKSDLHNILPTFVHPNSQRGHLPFGEVTGRPEYSNRAGAKLGGGVFEPPDGAKGRVARAMLYFYTRYLGDAVMQGEYSENFWNARVELFLRWNRQFPPDAEERRRNDLVEKWQGNRNPFVDDPALADRIGTDALRAPRRQGPQVRPEGFDEMPRFNPQALIESARMRPHQGGGGWWFDPTAGRR